MSLTGLRDDLLAGRVSSIALVDAALNAATDAASLNLMTFLDTEGARAAAVKADAALAAGTARPLEGLPIIVKDNLAVAGQPFSGGSRAIGAANADADAGTVAILRDAGAIVLGKGNLHEFAFGVTSDNATFGAVGNPAAPHLGAGGSSGGTAAAVAAGVVAAGLGTDTGGSGRIPASFCGCVGFRPSTGRYPASGVLQLTWTLDTVSTCARDVGSIQLLDGLLAGDARASDQPVPLAGLRLGVPDDSFAAGLDAPVAEAFDRALRRLEACGVRLEPVRLAALLDHDRAAAGPIALFEAGIIWQQYLVQRGITVEDFLANLAGPDVRDVFTAVLTDPPSPAAYGTAMNGALVPLRHIYAKLFAGGIDAIVFPTVPVPPPPLHENSSVMLNGEASPLFPTIMRNTSPGTLGGVPGISIPFGTLDGTLPFGLELDGPAGGDWRLLSIAAAVESAAAGA